MPVLQRGYVWNREQVRKLMRSLYKDDPIGQRIMSTSQKKIQIVDIGKGNWFMFYIVKNNVCKEYNYIRYGIRSFSKNRILGIGAISSLITFLSAVICFFILIVEFFLAEEQKIFLMLYRFMEMQEAFFIHLIWVFWAV